jgi:hypothetical protein
MQAVKAISSFELAAASSAALLATSCGSLYLPAFTYQQMLDSSYTCRTTAEARLITDHRLPK